MLKRKVIFCLALVLILITKSWSQGHEIGFTLPKNTSEVTFPFTLVNHLIVIPITINNHLTLKFIMDTGASSAILTERIFGEIMGLKYDRVITITGPGIIDSVSAYVANRIKIELPGGVVGSYMSLLVLEKDYIELKRNLGSDIYGIIGYDIFSRFIVEINYEKLEITLHDPVKFKPSRSFKEIPLTIEGTKPYVTGYVTQDDKRETLKLMMDTGASHSLLIDPTQTEYIYVPEKNIRTILGHGLGGEIPGHIGRVGALNIDNYHLNDILVSFPDEGMYSSAIKRGSRHGTIGGNVWSHFNMIIDFQNKKLYLRKNGNYEKPFEYDMSGLTIAFLENPERLQVIYVLPDSPADKAGIMQGDIVQSINGLNTSNTNLPNIGKLLRKREGKKIKARIKRDEDKVVKYIFRLQRLI